MCETKLVIVEQQGRHRYFRLADPNGVVMLDALLAICRMRWDIMPEGSPSPRYAHVASMGASGAAI